MIVGHRALGTGTQAVVGVGAGRVERRVRGHLEVATRQNASSPAHPGDPLVNFLTALGDLGFRCLTGAEFLRHYSRTATEPPIDVIAFLKPLVTARSTQLTARATDIMVADATSEKVGISSSDRRRRGRSGGTVAATLTFTA